MRRTLAYSISGLTLYFFSLQIFFVQVILAQTAAAQTIERPDEDELFTEDTESFESAKKKRIKAAIAVDVPPSSDLDFKAPQVEFDRENNIIRGSGGVTISQGGTLAQADRAEVNQETKDSELAGNVKVTTSSASLASDTSKFNMDTETGIFNQAQVTIEEGGYRAEAETIEKLSETKYRLFDAALTTCHCADGSTPWKINSSETNVTQESYAHCYNTSVEFKGVPVFYTPYLAFPVKTERQSGLLVPTYGHSSRDGVQFKQPIFVVLDDSTDITLTPFTESKTRHGTEFDFRKYFSRRSKIDTHMIYSNETPRDGKLRGTITDGIFDAINNPDDLIDDHRFLGHYRQLWRNDSDADIPLQFISNLHYASDDLAVREFDDDRIAEANSRYLTSNVVFRANLTDYLTSSLEGEYNQFIDMDDDLGFQRLPEANFSALKSFRPFGYNPLGARLVTRSQLSVTQFAREEGYDGTRINFAPNAAVPFHYKNYLSSEIGGGMRYTSYNLDNTFDPRSSIDLDDSTDRAVFNAYYGVSTAVEKVYGLDDDSWLVYLTNLGKDNQNTRLKRLKHTIEPFARYNYVPFTEQDDLPFFDSTDRIRQKSTVTYGFVTNLYGRFLPLSGSEQQITELTPRVEELPDLNTVTALPDLGTLDDYQGLGGAVSSRSGEIRNLASLSMRQVYDYIEDEKNLEPDIDPFSDIDTDLTLYPTNDFAISVQNIYDAKNHDVSYWALATHLRDDRGDSIKARYTFREDSVSQIEANLELLINQQLRLGYYTHFDEKEGEAIRQRLGLRLVSACNCWHLDAGVSERINPDKQQFYVTFTFSGLGDISQKFGIDEPQEQ